MYYFKKFQNIFNLILYISMKIMNKEKTEGKFVKVSIPKSIIEKIEQRIKQTGFESVSSYISYVLKEVLSEDEEEDVFSKEDEERVKERLKALGYLD